MDLKIKHFVVFITIIVFFSCRQGQNFLTRIEADQIAITDSIAETDSITAFIEPFENRINAVLDSTLTYAPKIIGKADGTYNTSAGNLMADIILAQANPIFKSRTGKDIDFALFNHGGIRSIISKGNVSARTAYEVMPFENNIVVVELSGKSVRDLVSFLIKSERPHPIAGIRTVLQKDNSIKSIEIHGIPFDENRNYFVATSNYLVTGGDNMRFFEGALSVTDTDYLIRNAMIDYFKKVDTLDAVVDDRFYKLK